MLPWVETQCNTCSKPMWGPPGVPVWCVECRRDSAIARAMRAAAKADIHAEVASLMLDMNLDEIEVLREVAQRLMKGRRQYGPLDLVADQRDWQQEKLEECCDGMVYEACDAVRRRRG